MEGDYVTLNTNVTEVLRIDQILWMFQVKNSENRIAEINKWNIDSNVMFGDRLQMESQTGFLTRTEHTGLYLHLCI